MKEYPSGAVKLSSGPLRNRYELNKQYVMSLSSQNLLRSFYMEAGLWSYSGNGGTTSATTTNLDGPETWHWGWESVTCELRGHMMGHWLSAAARIYAQKDDKIVKSKADHIVGELAKCQRENGGEWLAAFPESFMHRVAGGKWVWAPHYTVHKLFMGLLDMYTVAGNTQALDIAIGMASWFHRWTGRFSREKMDELLDMETGGMLEIWADLYGITGRPEHKELIYRYDRRRFFDALLEGTDVLTNKHANTQIPEILGAARAWEVTDDDRFRRIVEAFWSCAVSKRGYVCTGAGDDGELWMPSGGFAARMGVGQEHCCNYNMMRLAQVLLRWTGDPAYGDYWERRFINGVLAHQHGETGMISYFLGIGAGSRKKWGSPTRHFWCCHGTLIQANASYEHPVYMEHDDGIAVNQWIPSEINVQARGTDICICLKQDGQHAVYPLSNWNVEGMEVITKVHVPAIPAQRPDRFSYTLTLGCSRGVEFTLKLRMPWWMKGSPVIAVNGERVEGSFPPTSYCSIRRQWQSGDTVRVELPKSLMAETLPGWPDTVAFMDGPIVLAGLVDDERQLVGNPEEPATILVPDRERNHSWWNAGYYRTRGQEAGFRFIPLYEVKDEAYTVYFPVVPKS
ncbi:glycoside hydrolase family 127 protein [Paenibacillus sp. WST5]|uniref:Glycoside hydrolase family 127 protein n=2 Tax=Paenibacillus sedimenti TaxID=2770274 RepID=A0A926QKI7_9BACL|nr:glycoside hydrolase family 127 protein [Paenibacillus sedimenti]